MDVPDGYLAALVLTLALEVPIYAVGLGVRGLVAGVAGNLVTHPLIFVVLPIPPAFGEPLAWAIELVLATLVVQGHKRVEQVLTVVLAANVVSLVAGLLL